MAVKKGNLAADGDTATSREHLAIASSAFQEGGAIPRANTCDGMDRSPELSWSNVPEGARSLALIVTDPDAPSGTWTHWIIYNIPSDRRDLREGIPASPSLSDGGTQGRNDFGHIGYGGPCPPSGTHRYRFTLYALDLPATLAEGLDANGIQKEIQGHIVAQSTLTGRYERR